MGHQKRNHGQSSRKTRAIHAENVDQAYKKAPHSFVFHRGKVGVNVKTLSANLRKVMEPFTASRLKVNKKNVLKDFINIAGVLNVSHLVIFSKTEQYTQLRIARIPRGPTLTFQVPQYSLSNDVLSAQKKPDLSDKVFSHHPLLVLNGFNSEDKSVQLMMTMLQNMFPSINVHSVDLNHIKRCVLASYNPETKLIDFRHYTISVAPVGLSRAVKKLTKSHLPDLSNFQDISEFIERGGNLSESEGEQDCPASEVTLPQKMYGRGNTQASQSAIRLKEIGPRMTLELVKIEEGLCGGAVIHHTFIHKTQADLEADRKKKAQKLKLKRSRQARQKENVRTKEKIKEDHKQRSLEGMKRKMTDEQADDENSESVHSETGATAGTTGWFQSHGKRKKVDDSSQVPKKKFKSGTESKSHKKEEQKKVAPAGFRKKDQVKKQKKKKEIQKKLGIKRVRPKHRAGDKTKGNAGRQNQGKGAQQNKNKSGRQNKENAGRQNKAKGGQQNKDMGGRKKTGSKKMGKKRN